MGFMKDNPDVFKRKIRVKKTLMAKTKRLGCTRAESDPKLLCLLWLAGALALGTSVFAIQILMTDVLQGLEEHLETGNALTDHQERLTVTIYTAPAPFEGGVGTRQANAITSWLRLDPCPSVVLGKHFSLHNFASNRAPNVTVDTDLDLTFSGRPFFHGMVRRARSCSSDIVMLIDPDLILLDHVFRAIQSMRNFDQDWLLTALPLVVTGFPFTLQGQNFESFGVYAQEEIETYVRDHGIWDTCEGAQLWAWNGNQRPLHAGVMPPFVYKEGHHNHWLLSEAITSKYRVVLDASEAFTVFRTQIVSNCSYDTSNISATEKAISSRVYNSGNSMLESTYGSYYCKSLNSWDISHKLLNCDRMKSEKFGVVNMSQKPCSCSPLRPRWTPERRTWPAFYRLPTWTSWFVAFIGWKQLDSVARSWQMTWRNTHADLYYTHKAAKNQRINGGCNLLPYQNQFQCKDSKLEGSQIVDFNYSPSLESLLSWKIATGICS